MGHRAERDGAARPLGRRVLRDQLGVLGLEGQEPADWPAFVADGLARFSWPLAWGLESGHVAPNRTLPVGLPASLDGARGSLLIGEG